MPNAAAMIYESIWRDGDWRKLTRGAQCLYVQLLSQKELDCAGLLPLQPTKWVKGCDSMTIDELWADMAELQEHRFAFYDVDTDEVLIRTQVHKPFIIKGPKTRASAMRAARLCASPFLRKVLAAELRAAGIAEFTAVANELDPVETAENDGPDRVLEPYRNPIDTVSAGYPIDTPSIPTGTGTGTGISHLGNYSRGEERPSCARHPNGNPSDDPCHGCGRVRKWDERYGSTEVAEADAAKRRLRDIAANCPDCLGTNLIEVNDSAVAKCQHPYAAVKHA
jgi:hypothetical protein